MAEDFVIPKSKVKEERYLEILPQIEALVKDESDLVANLANISAALKFGMNFFWVGFYLVKEDQLVLGPFQGPVACTRIQFNNGVCGACYTRRETIIVPDVEQFPGHIACSSLSKSEIVIPIFKDDNVVMVLDVDSEELNNFDEIDKFYLEKITRLL
jgi:L-methionine (R)-S-oxide reductase